MKFDRMVDLRSTSLRYYGVVNSSVIVGEIEAHKLSEDVVSRTSGTSC
jgi:hypothetical protein